jgi:hypothetical protein
MTKVRFVGPIGGFSGAMDDMVFADHGEYTAAYMKHKRKGEPSEAQQSWNRRWDEAAAYAKSVKEDPAKWEFYKMVAKEKKMPVHALAMADYLTGPSFEPLNLREYRGQVGNPIKIRAFDAVGLVSCEVAIYSMEGPEIERGMAVEMGTRTGFWTYTATQPVALGSDVFIELTGVDYAGKRTKRTENPVVGEDR